MTKTHGLYNNCNAHAHRVGVVNLCMPRAVPCPDGSLAQRLTICLYGILTTDVTRVLGNIAYKPLHFTMLIYAALVQIDATVMP